MFLVPAMASGQGSSINSFSPYTFYGLGDISTQGAPYLRSMGGASVAYRFNDIRNEGRLNYVNPASVSSMSRKSFLFELGAEGANYYMRSGDKKSSYNTFNIRDIAIQLPLAKGLGFAVSVTPFSSIGYRSEIDETDPDILAGLYDGGAIAATYKYVGSGDVNQAKASIGWEPFRNFSIGVDMIYYFGKINRSYTTQISTRGASGFYNTTISQTDGISRIMWNFGAQYSMLLAPRRFMTIGAMYQPAAKLNPDVEIETANLSTDVTSLPGKNGLIKGFEMPQTISGGIYFHTHRMSIGMDYEFRDWAGRNDASEVTAADGGGVSMKYRNTNTVRAGFDFTPNRYDVRNPMKRVTYRAGVRYADYYMQFNGKDISDKAVTFGVGIPLSMQGFNYLDAGFEFGQRGSKDHGLVRENYFKINVGVRLFGDDNWFRKREFGR